MGGPEINHAEVLCYGRWRCQERLFSFGGVPMSDHIYKTIELVGSSAQGVEDAVQKAVAKASESLRNLRWFEVLETRGHIEGGRVIHWQVTLKIGFTLEGE